MQGIYIDVFSGMTYEELFPMIKDIGFNDFFSGHTYADDLEKLSLYKTQAEKLGLAQETSHSTIPLSDQIWNDNKHGDQYIEILKRNITNCSLLGIPILVVHVNPEFKQNRPLSLASTD